MQLFDNPSLRKMVTTTKWAFLILATAGLGAVCAEDAIIYEANSAAVPESATITPASTPVVVASLPKATSTTIAASSSSRASDVPALSVNDQPVMQVVLSSTDDVVTKTPSNFPWKKKIVTTTFWVGQDATTYNDTTNYSSAWDTKWTKSFGGTDNPSQRFGFLPKGRFAVTQNPFYFALPFNDVKYPDLARKWVPWYNKEQAKQQRYTSQCKGRWIEIRNADGKACYAQWQDVGPFRYDHAQYVFGKERPTTYNKAGLDVSPAVKTFLGLDGLDLCDWRFVEAWEVREGPWITYGEQAIIMSAIKQREQDQKAGIVAKDTAKVPAPRRLASAQNPLVE